MKTVKEVSRITGISVRTLHYYDEVGLFKPTEVNEAGYRLYDDKALETLQQILFFREFDMPLKEIKAIMGNPDLDRQQILSGQRRMLVMKKERLERMIANIDGILKGEEKVDFTVFGKEEIEKMYHSVMEHMTEEQKDVFMKEYGSMEQFEKHFMEKASGEEAQKNFAKVVEWYGDKESAMEAALNPKGEDIMKAYASRMDAVLRKLAAKLGKDVNSFEVKEIVGEYDFVAKQMYQMKDVSAFSLEMARMYRTNKEIQEKQDAQYGQGTTEFIGCALEAYYKS